MGEAFFFQSDEPAGDQVSVHPAAEFIHDQRIGHKIDLLEQYGDSAANLSMRFEVYKYAMDGMPIMQDQVFNQLAQDLQPDDTVLDVGCADKRFLAKIRRDLHHTGRLIGVDPVKMTTMVDSKLVNEGLEPIEFIQQKASELTLPPGSISKITALFSLYYDPKALNKLYEILEDGGHLYVAVPGIKNKMRHRVWENYATQKIREQNPDDLDLAYLQPPLLHAAPFTAEIAGVAMSRLFSEIVHNPQRTFMKIDSPESQDAYRWSLLSMYPNLAPYWRNAIDDEVMPLIRREIDEFGYYWDIIDRHSFDAKKKAASEKAA